MTAAGIILLRIEETSEIHGISVWMKVVCLL